MKIEKYKNSYCHEEDGLKERENSTESLPSFVPTCGMILCFSFCALTITIS